MGQSIVVDTKQLKNIVGANTAIASSVVSLFELTEKLGNDEIANQLRAELDKVITEAEKIQASVRTVIDENR